MPWDRERYLAEVLEPARKAGNVPPPDLFARYGLTAGLADQAAFDRQVADVVTYWRELKTRRTYAGLADTLLAAHTELERAGRLTLSSLAERHQDAHRRQIERLTHLAEAEAGAATHVGPDAVARLRGALDETVSEAEASGALTRAGVRIVEKFPDLPVMPHPKQADLARYLGQLSVWPSAAVVFGDAIAAGFGVPGFRVLGGFRLASGQTLDDEAFAAARRRVEALRYADPAKTPSENVLAILRAAARKPGDLDALLLSEVVERLRPLARSGFLQRSIATQAAGLGLDEDEAGLIAAAILSAGSVGTLRQQVEDELTGSRLRSAQQLAAGLPADDPLRERISALDAEVASLTGQAEAELAQDRSEQAAALLAEAAAVARDDAGLPARLAAIPPPGPREPVARADGDHVLITWTSSPVTIGPVEYRVMRGQDRAPLSPSEGTAVVTRTERTEVSDAEAPPGASLFYSIFAGRGGDAWSRPASAPPVSLTPEAGDVTVTVTDTSVTASWRPHPGAESVLVVRREDETGDETGGTPVEASLTGFTDTGLRTLGEYYYRIVTCYRAPDGQRRCSAGVVVLAVPEAEPGPVTDLSVTDLSTTGPGLQAPALLAAWTPPPYGHVRLVRGDEPPPWPAGTRVRPQEYTGLADVPGLPRRNPDGRDVVELRLPFGRHHLLALTEGRNVSVTGNAVEVRLAEPVRDLSADRRHDEVRLAWVWPEGATDALVTWPGGERRLPRRVVDDEGAAITVGAAAVAIEVRAIYPRRGGTITAPGTRVEVPARGIAVSYHVRRTGRPRARQRTIELIAERAVRLPALVVVRSTGRYAPDDPSEGEVVARAEPRHVTPGQTATVPAGPVSGPAWLACFVDPQTPEAEARALLLFPPPAEEMWIP